MTAAVRTVADMPRRGGRVRVVAGDAQYCNCEGVVTAIENDLSSLKPVYIVELDDGQCGRFRLADVERV